MFEGNGLDVISPIQNSDFAPHWSISSIILDINLAALDFNLCAFSHVIRKSNCMTHAFTTWATFCSSYGPSSSFSLPTFLRWRV
jgi:hypothetical protein